MATRIRSFSKVNLGLRIGPVRADGFHGLTTMYQTLALHDVVTVTARPADSGTRVSLTTDHLRVPVDSRNTAWQMVERALAALGVRAEVAIHIEKRLPVQGGMGAGSANAAAALIGLERELGGWGGGVPQLGAVERLRLAAEVGSDVPLFLVGGAVLGLGRGELVAPLPDVTVREAGGGVPCVVALPSIGVSTPLAFREWDNRQAASAGEGGAGQPDGISLTSASQTSTLEELSLAYSSAYALSAGWGSKPGTSGIVDRPSQIPLQEGVSREDGRGEPSDLAGNTLLALVRTGIENDFEEVVFPHYPSLRETKRLLMGEDSGQPAMYAALSGSGSAIFGLYGSEEDARAAQQRVRSLGTEALLTETLTRAQYWSRMFADVG